VTNYIWPDDLTKITNLEIQALVEIIRARRARIGDTIVRAKKAAAGISIGALRDAIDSELLKFKKMLEKTDANIEKLEKHMMKVSALRIQLDDKE